jgi:hypothetical protein
MQSRKSPFKGRQFTSEVSWIFRPADADQFWSIWNRLDGVLPVPWLVRVLRMISRGWLDDS